MTETTWTERIDNIQSRLANLVSAQLNVDNFYNYDVSITNSTDNSRDKFNPNIDDVLVFTVTVTDINGDAVEDLNVSCSVNKGYFTKYNNTSISGTSTKTRTGTTNSSGQFTLTYKCSEWGIINFSANNSNIQIKVTGWKQLWQHHCFNDNNQATITIYSTFNNIKTLTIFGTINCGANSNNIVDYIPSGYVPSGVLAIPLNDTTTNQLIHINANTELRISNPTSSTSVWAANQVTYI